jgi:hypothetical protein
LASSRVFAGASSTVGPVERVGAAAFDGAGGVEVLLGDCGVGDAG